MGLGEIDATGRDVQSDRPVLVQFFKCNVSSARDELLDHLLKNLVQLFSTDETERFEKRANVWFHNSLDWDIRRIVKDSGHVTLR